MSLHPSFHKPFSSERRARQRSRHHVKPKLRLRVFRAMPTGIAVRGTFAFASRLDYLRGFDVPLWIEARIKSEQRPRWWWR